MVIGGVVVKQGLGQRFPSVNASQHFLKNDMNDWRKDPRIGSYRHLVRNRIAEILLSDANHIWQQPEYNFVFALENQLFLEASSLEDYMNQDPLRLRLQNLVQRKMVNVNICQQQPIHTCNSDEADQFFNRFNQKSTEHNRRISGNVDQFCHQIGEPFNPSSGDGELQPFSTMFCNGVSYEELLMSGDKPGTPSMHTASPVSTRQGASEVVLSPDMSSTITTSSSGDGFCEFGDSDLGPIFNQSDYPCSSRAYFGDKYQEQCMAHGIYNSQNLSNAKRENSELPNSVLDIPANVSQMISDFCPGMDFGMSNATFDNSLQPKPLMLEQNRQQACSPYELFDKSLKNGKCCFPKQNVNHSLIDEQMMPVYPQSLAEQSHSIQVASESSGCSRSSNATGLASSRNKLVFSLEHKILLAYINYKSSMNSAGDCVVSFVNHLHSTVCNSNMCMCGHYCLILEHFDVCGCTDCEICGPFRSPSINSEFYQNFENLMPPAKRLKLSPDFSENMLSSSKPLTMEEPFYSPSSKNSIVSILSPMMLQPCDLGKLTSLQHLPESPKSINSETVGVNIELLKNPTSVDKVTNSTVNKFRRTNTEDILPPLEEIVLGFDSEKKRDCSSVCDVANDMKDDFDLGRFNSYPLISDELGVMSKEEMQQVVPDSDLTRQEREHESYVLKAEHDKEMKPLVSVRRGVSLVEFFTAKEIREHISSLRQCIGQSILKDDTENKLLDTVNESLCQLCALEKLLLAPQPIYCSACSARIKSGVIYYATLEENRVQHCFCAMCYRGSRCGSITFHGTSFSKAKLGKKKNIEEVEEPWVQCDKCKQWQHQICGLFNDKCDMEGKAEYMCPKCCLQEIESREHIESLKATAFGARDLPSTMLSDYIEERLFRGLKLDREARARHTGKKVDEVTGAEDLVVRVVLSINKRLQVNKPVLEFHGENYPAEFPYRSKVILLFQKIEGVDVCLFGLYVQEFGSECGHPNQRSVYISYLDSVKYFRPETRTATGEALRTFVYHEILIGYLEYCKKRGFVNCYLWACPPLKGEDYILYCHPETQKTPKSEKLRQWYHSMLRKAAKENIVVNCSNFYDHFFVPTGKLNSKITATRLPYFDGDYWSGPAENIIKNFELQNGEYSSMKVKKTVTKRTLKAMGHTDSSVVATKDILLMQKLGQIIFPHKEDLIIAHLQFVCTHCHESILSGWRWFCSLCKNFQLCERCHDAEQNINDGETHTVNSKEKHLLSKVVVNGIPSDTEDQDVILHNWLFEYRHSFLGYFQKNHYQFDTLRRAKHSSMMILHHLRNPTLLTSGGTCNICHQNTNAEDTNFCSACIHTKRGSSQIQKLTQCSNATNHGTESKDGPKAFLEELLDVLQHASQCQTNESTCDYPNCLLIKKLFRHATKCNIRFAGGCLHCQKVWYMLKLHSTKCRQRDCSVPRCKDLKKHAEMLALQSDTQWRGTVPGLVGWQVTEDDISKD